MGRDPNWKDAREEFALRLREAGRAVVNAAHTGFPGQVPPLAEVRDLEVAGAAGPLPGRLYVPHGAQTPGPTLIFFHGGGFFAGSLTTHDGVCRWLADASRLRIVSIDYRLAPEHPFPAPLEDALAGAHWAIDHAETLGIDLSRLGIGGDSAGGYLAASTSLALNAAHPGAVKLQLLIYPLLHIDEATCASEAEAVFRVLGQTAAWVVRGQVLPKGTTAPTLLDDDLAAAPPAVIVSAGLDPLRSEAAAFADRLTAAGVAVQHLRYERMTHGGLNFPGLFPAARGWLADIGREVGGRLHATD